MLIERFSLKHLFYQKVRYLFRVKTGVLRTVVILQSQIEGNRRETVISFGHLGHLLLRGSLICTRLRISKRFLESNKMYYS